MLNEVLITFIKTVFMDTANSYTFLKIINKKTNSKKESLKYVMLNVAISIIYTIIYQKLFTKIQPIVINVFEYIVFLTLFMKLINEKISGKTMLVACISLVFGFVSFLIATILCYTITRLDVFSWLEGYFIEYLIAGVIQLILIYCFFNIRRFKDGFSFLKNDSKIINIIGIAISSAIILMFITYCLHSNTRLLTHIFSLIILLVVFMFDWIKRSITKYYKKRMRDRTIENQAEQIREKDETIQSLKQELSAVLQINHKYNHRLSAMEQAVSKLNLNEEFANEYAEVLDSVKKLSKEYKTELKTATNLLSIPKTNIFSVDTIIEYMKSECIKENINFNVEINCNVNEIIENCIDTSKLETLLADHIRDAIIAVNSSNCNKREIMLKFNKLENIYEIEIFDTGIEFTIDTLLNLGLEKVTTHKDTGGNGIGFMTTFETMRATNASLEIQEFSNAEYTKVIRIKFDDKNEYRIYSFRSQELKSRAKNKRIIIEKL